MNKTFSKNPEAYIAVGKDRKKVYNDNVIYLENQTEFQFEIFNPTSKKVLAKFFINGESISNKGLVLNPGERVWLDRYLDNNKKFLFSTYEVEDNNDVVKEAIENNGDIEVKFYEEQVWNIFDNNVMYGSNTIPVTFNSTGNDSYTFFNTTNTTNIKGDIVGTYTNTTSEVTLDSMNDLKSNTVRSLVSDKTIETGRVEKGGESDQVFEESNYDFSPWCSHNIKYKILPVSQQNIITSNELRRYCSNCGRKVKQADNFCSSCGHKL